MPKLVVSRKNALIEQAKNKPPADDSSENSDFAEDDLESDFEDQLESNRMNKRRKRDENLKAEERKVISNAYLPSGSKKLSACIFCKLVLNRERWRQLEHCPNCPHSSGLADTTEEFSNLIGSVLPKVSWVAQWQAMQQFIPGFYAMAIQTEQVG